MSQHSNAYVPKSGLAKWFESRLPILGLLHSSFIVFPVPRNLNYWWTFGAVLFTMLIIQLATGIFLAMFYVSDTKEAFNSFVTIIRDVPYGELLRNMHANGASFFFLAVYIHIFRGMFFGSYKAPREVLWILGVVIYFLMMGTAFLGYSLPWGQMSMWAATVITSLVSAIPLVGDTVKEYIWGGFSVSTPTLNRFFSLHYLLPFMILGISVLHVWALHVVGNNNPSGVEIKTPKDSLTFHPYMTMKDVASVCLFLIAFCWFVFYMPNYLGHADNFIPANPDVTPNHIVPEWYFLPFYAILRSIENKLIGVIAMVMAIAILAFLPWLDTSKVRSGKYRPVFKIFFWLWVIDCLVLGWLGAKPIGGYYTIASQIGTIYYFLYFIAILPALGFFEKTKPLPASILDDVLSKHGGTTASAAH